MPDAEALKVLLPVALETDKSGAAAGVEAEVVSLFHQYRARLLRYLYCLGLSVQDGEEISQEVFLLLFRHLLNNKSRENLLGWIFRVAHNLGLKRRLEGQHYLGAVENSFWNSGPADPSPSPEERIFNQQRREKLLSVVKALPAQQQWCLFLRAEGLHYREIGDVLGISLGTVSQSLSKAIGRLKNVDVL